ncbi:MAG: sulfurtransferase [Flavobacteriales bacterium]|nr:MAG: sulfurtransferase [Flavobacteriales bacterium]
MGLFNFFGSNKNSKVQEYIDNGAVVIDVRTVAEFNDGHVPGSKNIVLDTIENHIEEIKNLNKPIVTCCRSGARSGSAASILKNHNIDAINGGPWQNVASCLQSTK